ncbi:MAG: hypothetical protein DYG92_10620 [Leptolyngbya sp. PLA1]|nr:hypothetical protein [Leptolyngbya sp. PLA1]
MRCARRPNSATAPVPAGKTVRPAARGPGPMIDPRDSIFRRHRPSDPIHEHRQCHRCGYDLIGLKSGDRCPECGVPIRFNPGRVGESMTEAPKAYLTSLAAAAWKLVVGCAAGVGLSVLLVFLLRGSSTVSMAVAVMAAGSAGLWWWGVMGLCKPRQTTQPTTVNLEQEWKWLRVLSRCSQAGWPVAYGLIVIGTVLAMGFAKRFGPGAGPGPVSSAYLVAGAVAAVVAFAGLVPLSIFMSCLADWANDLGLGRRLRMAPFALAGSLPLGLIEVVLVMYSLGRARIVFIMPLIVLFGLGFLALFGYFALALYQFAELCTWAVKNSDAASDRDARLGVAIAKRIEDGLSKPKPGSSEADAPSERAPSPPVRRAPGDTYDLAPLDAKGPDAPG